MNQPVVGFRSGTFPGIDFARMQTLPGVKSVMEGCDESGRRLSDRELRIVLESGVKLIIMRSLELSLVYDVCAHYPDGTLSSLCEDCNGVEVENIVMLHAANGLP